MKLKERTRLLLAKETSEKEVERTSGRLSTHLAYLRIRQPDPIPEVEFCTYLFMFPSLLYFSKHVTIIAFSTGWVNIQLSAANLLAKHQCGSTGLRIKLVKLQ